MSKKETVKTLTLCGMLIALDVVLARFLSLNTPITRIGFSFIPAAAAAYLYGPLGGALVHGISDVIGAILFPLGPYFPGYTVTAVLIGCFYGLCFRKNSCFWRVVLGVAAQSVCSLFLTTFWTVITSTKGAAYGPMLLTRLPQVAVVAVAQLLLIPPLLNLMKRIKL